MTKFLTDRHRNGLHPKFCIRM